MSFLNRGASMLVPDGVSVAEAYRRTTHLGIGAHGDDLEIMAFHGIRLCYQNPGLWFGGVTCTNGRGNARTGSYAGLSDEEMAVLRKKEQDDAAVLGQYSFMAQLDYSSMRVKEPGHVELEEDLKQVLAAVQPRVVYTHNPADKHETHVAVIVAVIAAMRALPVLERPDRVYGCEVWRDLDWLDDSDKVALDVSDSSGLGKRLVDVFQSQIGGGKRYDHAVLARNRANATFYRSHEVDECSHLLFAMDLTPLVKDESIDIIEYVLERIRRFQKDVEKKLKHRMGKGL